MINLPVMYYKSSFHVTPSDSGMVRIIPLMCAAELIQAKITTHTVFHLIYTSTFWKYFSSSHAHEILWQHNETEANTKVTVNVSTV